MFIRNNIAIFIFSVLSSNAKPPVRFIIGGTSVSIDEIPFQVSLEYDSGGCILNHGCGGIILNEYWILTAAHCVDFTTEDDITVHAGSTLLSDNSVRQRIEADKIITPSDYTNPYSGDDIALIRLAKPLCFNNQIQPI